MDSSFTPNLEHSERIARSIRVLGRGKEGVLRNLEGPLQEMGVLTSWDLSFAEYIEEHKNSKLLFCWYDGGVGVVFSSADYHGIWAAQRGGTLSKGPRTRVLCNLSRWSGEEQRSNLICPSEAENLGVNTIATSSD